MTTRVISEWETSDDRGKAVIFYSDSEEMFFIEYFDNKGHRFYTEEFPDKSIYYVEDAAQNWTLGIKKLDMENT